MKTSGTDSLNSWIVSFACCFINMMMYGMSRLSGMLFVASTSRFNVSRQQASLPYTFASFMRNTAGPLVGFLGHRYGVRPVTTFGCLLGAIGVGACFFAENINTVTVLWGAVFGLGFGLGNVLLPVSINQHFDRHRATGSGISFSGACLSSFVLPPIMEVTLHSYGLSGTYLFLSGFILNCIPAALLLRKPRTETKVAPSKYDKNETQCIVSSTKEKLYSEEDNSRLPIENLKMEVNILPTPRDIDVPCYGLTYEEKIKRLSTQTLLSDYSIRMSASEPLDVEQIIKNSKGKRTVDPKIHKAETLSVSSQTSDQDGDAGKDEVFEKVYDNVDNEKFEIPVNEMRRFPVESKENIKHLPTETYVNYGYQNDNGEHFYQTATDQNPMTFISTDISKDQKLRLDCVIDPSDLKNLNANHNNFTKFIDYPDTNKLNTKHDITSPGSEKVSSLSKNQSSLKSFSVIFDPMFILIAVTNAIYCSTFVCMITIIVDFSRDLHIGTSNEKYVLMSLSVGDFIGRAGLGWITDRGYISSTGFAALCFACQGVLTVAVVLSDGFFSLVIFITLYGLSEAGIIIIYPIIIAQYIDPDKQTIAIPSSNFLSGPLCLAIAPIIGYFRDEIGSYEYIFYGIGILSGLCCISLLFAPLIAKCRAKTQCRTK